MGKRAKKRKSAGVYWCAKDQCYHFKFKNDQGKWMSKSTGKDDIVAALGFKEEFVGKVKAGTLDRDQGNWTLQQAASRWLEYRTSAGKAVKCDRLLIKRLLEVFGGEKKLKTFTTVDLENYVLARRRNPSPKTQRMIAPRTLIMELRCLRWILDRADLWSAAMAKAYKRLGLKAPKERIGQVLTEDQVKKLVSLAELNVKGNWFVAFWAGLLAHETSCRSVEIRKLHIANISPDGPTPLVTVNESKSEAGKRVIPLTATAQLAARKLIERARILGSSSRSDHLLPLNHGKRHHNSDPLRGRQGFDFTMHQTSWGKAWRSLRKEAGLGNFRFHDLRCCAITNMALAGVQPEVRLTLSGHTSEAMNRHYIHVLMNAKANAVQALESTTGGLFKELLSTPR